MIAKINLWIIRICTTIAGIALVFMGAIAFVDSIGRPLGHPLPGASEYVSFALMIFFFAALPVVVRDDAHIRVGLFSDLYRPRLMRIERYFTALLETAAFAAFAWMMFDQAARLERFGTLSVFFEIPMAPWVMAAGVFTVVATWFALIRLRHLDTEPHPHPHALPDEEDT
ncbi:TRAP transporter small permease [Paenirhodobacter populi]|uniref:TRAP transporter small permease protein n=1 Tax=Paenirhodobacter populi TaxID=2306993 RepID=A0A443ITH5_9RHOB|nr:TRAP transporter small permease [Sinirhodobacter populi]RWR11006.1 TRAP transporter small permease [Sinirhodobacter populi]